MKVLDLFSGIGGFSLGLERAGFETIAFCEIDPFCRKVLKKHWPDIPMFENVEHLSYESLASNGIIPDVICGGFPCQDISFAGNGAGLAGARSGLWFELFRIIREIRPSYAIMENVSALLGRGLDTVLGNLASIGYDAEWHCIPASIIGAPHQRDRIWIIAYPASKRRREAGEHRCNKSKKRVSRSGDESPATNANSIRFREPIHRLLSGRQVDECRIKRGVTSNNISKRSEGNQQEAVSGLKGFSWCEDVGSVTGIIERASVYTPALCRAGDGIPNRVDRTRALGNAVVPQIPEIIGRAIMEFEKAGAA